MKEMFLGVETEYALSGPPGSEREAIASRMVDYVRDATPSLPGLHEYDRFLANGSRFYIDCGAHPEMSTPECSSPSELLRYIRAGEELLTRVLEQMTPPNMFKDLNESECIELFRSNVDYSGAKTTWGSHESYLYKSDPAIFPDQIVPHLVSRVIYTGAGGFNPFSKGIEFTMSPRAWHLERVASGSSTDRRGIFHFKNEPLAKRGFNRLHLLCGETLCSDIATWLRVGCTALVVAMIDAGVKPGAQVQLRKPLAALRAFVGDPDCKTVARLVDGRKLTALEIQRHYLHLAEDSLGCRWMPDWAEEVCKTWRSMLDRVEQGPDAVCTRLDWAIKLAVYRDYAERTGIRWDDLPTWNLVNRSIRSALGQSSYNGRVTVELVLGKEKTPSPIPETIDELTPIMEEHSLSWDLLRPYVDLQKKLLELDFRFGQLGKRGFFGQLDRSGVLEHKVKGIGRVDLAVNTPPAMGRARVRGRRIKMYAGREGYKCYWTKIYDLIGERKLMLADPFISKAPWKKMSRGELDPDDPMRFNMRARTAQELLERMRLQRRRR